MTGYQSLLELHVHSDVHIVFFREQVHTEEAVYQSLLELHVHSDERAGGWRDTWSGVYQSLLELHVHSDKQRQCPIQPRRPYRVSISVRASRSF
jgi:hypothetical protein